MSLFDDLTLLKQDLLAIPQELGHPDMIQVQVSFQSISTSFRAVRQNISYSQTNWLLAAGVRVNTDITSLGAVPRSINRTVLEQGIYVVQGETYRALSVDIESSITYRILLNKVRNR